MTITAAMVKDLRERTGAGIMECKTALADAGGDLEKAAQLLRERGIVKAERKEGRPAAEGIVAAYVHAGGKIGVLLELNCETDFVARTEKFQALGKDLAMQVAAMHPRWVRREEIPPEVLGREREILRGQAQAEGKPAPIVEKIVEGRLEKFLAEQCLLEQAFIKDQERKVRDVVRETAAVLGENIVVRRFCRYHAGESAGAG